MSPAVDGSTITKAGKKKRKIKAKALGDPHSEASSSSSCSLSSSSLSTSSPQKRGLRLHTRRRHPIVFSRPFRDQPGRIEALALPLGMSIAAVVSQVLERGDATCEGMSVDLLTQVCVAAVQESLMTVFGDKFDYFVVNFEKSFRSTLSTLRSINRSVKAGGDEIRMSPRRKILSDAPLAFNRPANLTTGIVTEDRWAESHLPVSGRDEHSITDENIEGNPISSGSNEQHAMHDTDIVQQLALVSANRTLSEFQSADNRTLLGTLEKSVIEQARSNDLKTYEMGLTMKKLRLKERQLFLNSDANFLERCKLSFGFKKASFKLEKFKNQVEETRYGELLKKCIDCLVAGLFIMLGCVAYAVYVYSHKRISEATASCTPKETNSWWIPKPMASFSSVMQILRCQFQVLTRMLAGGIMVLAIAYLLLLRSSTINQSMPVTFILLLLGVACGFAGKLCIDSLGGSGNHWLLFWEILCAIHLFSNVWTSALFAILYGPVTETEKKLNNSAVPYLLRRCTFYATVLLFLPLSCGFLPFASFGEWKDHFSSLLVVDTFAEDRF